MNEATRRLSLTLGMLAGLMGIEHGIGEVLEGYRLTDSMFILSWPNSAFFEVMAGEPALTIVPNYLVTGLLAIFFSCTFLVAFAMLKWDGKTIPVLFGLLILMLLTGGGLGPPLLGIIAVLIALKSNSSFLNMEQVTYRSFAGNVESFTPGKACRWRAGLS